MMGITIIYLHEDNNKDVDLICFRIEKWSVKQKWIIYIRAF